MNDVYSFDNVEILPIDFALAYSALARRVAAADAYLLHNDTDNARREIEAAMQAIEQVEKLPMIAVPSKGGSNG
jgi:hypothetical protein